MKNKVKNTMIASLIIASSIAVVSFATPAVKANAKARFSPNDWSSQNTKDVITIKTPTVAGSTYYNVKIYVSQIGGGATGGTDAGAIQIKNCNGVGSADIVNPGSTVICSLSSENPVLTFSANNDTNAAHGDYQVE